MKDWLVVKSGDVIWAKAGDLADKPRGARRDTALEMSVIEVDFESRKAWCKVLTAGRNFGTFVKVDTDGVVFTKKELSLRRRFKTGDLIAFPYWTKPDPLVGSSYCIMRGVVLDTGTKKRTTDALTVSTEDMRIVKPNAKSVILLVRPDTEQDTQV